MGMEENHSTEAQEEIRRLRQRVEELERERDAALARVRHDSELMAAIIDAIPVMITIYDPQLRSFRFNSELRRVLGWTEEDMLTGDPMEKFYPDPDDRQQVRQYMQSLQSGWRDFTVAGKDGRSVESTWANIRLADDTLIGIGIDIRERKQLEDDLRRARDLAEDASRAKSEFLANMSHEIRTPMTVILAALEHLLPMAGSEDRRHLLQMADDAARRLLTLIDDLLDIARIEARKLQVVDEPFELRLAVEKVLEPFRLKARRQGVRLGWEIAADIPWLTVGDANRLGQVLTNLVGNAVKFTERGEVAVSVSKEPGGIRFSVRDTGIGIPADKLQGLFQTFNQLDASRTRRFGGTGLGLALSRRLVELMGGEITVESEEGRGSIFSFVLPLAAAEKESAPAAGDRPVRILLVEDDAMVRDLIEMILRQRGWTVTTAENGREAVEKYRPGEIDLILMDLQMPEVDGFEATRRIRSRETGGRRVPVIALTAHARREDREECLRQGMDGWLPKPVTMNDLYAAVEEQLSGCRALAS